MAQVAAMKGTLQAMAESTETISSRGREANLLLKVISEYLPKFGYAREPPTPPSSNSNLIYIFTIHQKKGKGAARAVSSFPVYPFCVQVGVCCFLANKPKIFVHFSS